MDVKSPKHFALWAFYEDHFPARMPLFFRCPERVPR
jgi:hypothetical protein